MKNIWIKLMSIFKNLIDAKNNVRININRKNGFNFILKSSSNPIKNETVANKKK